MSQSDLTSENLINRPSKLRRSSEENLAMSSDGLQTRSSESPIDGLHLLRCMLNPGNPDGFTDQSSKASPRSVSISPIKDRITMLPPPAVSPIPVKADSVPKNKCLCAPTTHAGSFRCRLHRLPPSQSAMSTATRKGFSQLSSPKSKAAMSQRSLSTSSSRGHEHKPSRLSRMAMAEAAQKQATEAEEKAPSEMERSAPTTNCSEYGPGNNFRQFRLRFLDVCIDETTAIFHKSSLIPLVDDVYAGDAWDL